MTSTKKVLNEDKYKKLTHHEHVLECYDMYIGNIKNEKTKMFIFEDNKIQEKEIIYNAGLYKLFDEVLINARM